MKTRTLQNVSFNVGNGYWGMIQDSIDRPGDVDFFITREGYGAWLFCHSMPWHCSTPEEKHIFKWDEESIQGAIDMFMGQLDIHIECFYERFEDCE